MKFFFKKIIINTKKNPISKISYCLFGLGILINFLEYIYLCSCNKSIKFHVSNFICLLVICAISKIFFHKQKFNEYNNLIICLSSLILFPIMFFINKGLNGSFVYFFYLSPLCFGLIVNNKKKLILPLLNLIINDILLVISLKYYFVDYINFNLNTKCAIIYGYDFSFILLFLFVYFFIKNISKEKEKLINKNKMYLDIANKDELTSLYNRRKFDMDVNNEFYKYGIILDIDDFKKVNDTYGHQVGDEVLKLLSSIVLKYCSDEFKIYRYGGEEFFILSRCDFETTRELINIIYSDVHSMFKIPNIDKMITISSGMALHSDDLTVKGFVKKADDNLYLAKQNGKDIIYFENSPMV